MVLKVIINDYVDDDTRSCVVHDTWSCILWYMITILDNDGFEKSMVNDCVVHLCSWHIEQNNKRLMID